MTEDALGPRVGEILDRLAAQGMRRTAPRQAILEALLATQGHITADELIAQVQQRFPSVNASTIYRTLEVLETLGVVDHVHLGHGPAVYHVADREHQHLVCERCSRIEDLPLAKMRPFIGMLQGEFGFSLAHRHFALVGLCRACRGT